MAKLRNERTRTRNLTDFLRKLGMMKKKGVAGGSSKSDVSSYAEIHSGLNRAV